MADQLEASVLLPERIREDGGTVSRLGVGPSVVRLGTLVLAGMMIVDVEPKPRPGARRLGPRWRPRQR